MESIPILDLKNLPINAYDGNSVEAEEISHKFKKMLFSTGYCVIINHGIPDFVVEDAYTNSRKFIELPAIIKSDYSKSENKEKSYAGYYISKRQPFRERFDITHEAKYPSQAPHFNKSLTEYRNNCNGLVKYLLILVAKAINLKDDFFIEEHSAIFNDWQSTKTKTHLSIICYRNDESSPCVNEYLMQKHTDYSTFTLLTSSSPGLQIFSKNGWIKVDTVRSDMVFHVGDLLEKWTGGLCLATVHRVLKLNKLEVNRISIPYFIHPNSSTIVKPLCGNKSDHPAVTAESYWKNKFNSNPTIHQLNSE